MSAKTAFVERSAWLAAPTSFEAQRCSERASRSTADICLAAAEASRGSSSGVIVASSLPLTGFDPLGWPSPHASWAKLSSAGDEHLGQSRHRVAPVRLKDGDQ